MKDEPSYTRHMLFDRILHRSDSGTTFAYWGISYWMPSNLCLVERLPTAKRAGSVRYDPRAEPEIKYLEVA